MADLLGALLAHHPLRALLLESVTMVSFVAVHEASVLRLAGASFLQRRRLHLREPRPEVRKNRHRRRLDPLGAAEASDADGEPRREEIHRTIPRRTWRRSSRESRQSSGEGSEESVEEEVKKTMAEDGGTERFKYHVVVICCSW